MVAFVSYVRFLIFSLFYLPLEQKATRFARNVQYGVRVLATTLVFTNIALNIDRCTYTCIYTHELFGCSVGRRPIEPNCLFVVLYRRVGGGGRDRSGDGTKSLDESMRGRRTHFHKIVD